MGKSIAWLGVEIRPREASCNNVTTFGYVVPRPKLQQMLDTLTQLTEPPEGRLDVRVYHLAGWLACLNEQLQAWRHAYEFADNAPEVFRAVDDHAHRRVQRLLARVTRKTYSQLNRLYRQRLPRGFFTWQVDGVQLVVLSARAPRAPQVRVRQPPWAQHRMSKPQDSENP
ncbi:MAG: hypothetical protein NUV77_20970 [Thermoguttaceae bacterium]|nr:hypothetical protein [Thermoguttaceae bacterium]